MPWSSLELDWLIRFLRETAAATFVVGVDGYVLDVPEWTALTGQTAEEAEGDGWMAAIHPDDTERVANAWRTAVAHFTPYNTDYRLRCADGSYRWFNARATAMLDENGDARRWVGAIFPIPGTARLGTGGTSSRAMPADRFDDISPAALRAARAILNWPAEKLAEAAGISRSTVRRLEEDQPAATPRKASVDKILRVLADQGLECVGHGSLIVGVIDPTTRRLRDSTELRAGETVVSPLV